MANFLVLTTRPTHAIEGERQWRRALDMAQALKGERALKTAKTSSALAASFARQNGSGGALVLTADEGAFLLAAGTWLHRDGYGSGSEQQLLQRLLAVGAEQLAQEIEGFFFIAASIGDDEMLAITDIVGSHHAFMRELDGSFALAGSSAVLAALAPFTLDETGCQEFIRTGIMYEQRTLYNEVRKLPPASILFFRGGRLTHQQRYWNPRELARQPLNRTQAVEALYTNGVKTVRRIAALYAHPLSDLTGGYDSRALAALLLAADVKFDTTVSGSDDSVDVQISRGLAELAELKHIKRQRSADLSFDDLAAAFALCDGEYDIVEYAHIMLTHREHSKNYDVTLNGSFGEVARGYWWELLAPRIGGNSVLDSAKIARKRYAAASKGAHLFAPQQRIDLDRHFAEILKRNNDGFESLPNTLQLDYSYLMLRMQRWQGRIASSTDQIWPCVSPFMFRSILEIMLRAEPRARYRSLLVRAMLARYNPIWAAYPLEHGYPAEPFGLRNAWRFLPLVQFYGEKVAQKLGQRLGKRKPAAPSAGEPLSARLMLDPRISSLLDPQYMLSAKLYDKTQLSNLLAPERQPELGNDVVWARALSIEYTLRKIASEVKPGRE